jgi:hypothetical protein
MGRLAVHAELGIPRQRGFTVTSPVSGDYRPPAAQAVFSLDSERRFRGRERSDPQNHGPCLTADRVPPIFGQRCHGAVRRRSPAWKPTGDRWLWLFLLVCDV